MRFTENKNYNVSILRATPLLLPLLLSLVLPLLWPLVLPLLLSLMLVSFFSDRVCPFSRMRRVLDCNTLCNLRDCIAGIQDVFVT